MPAPKKDLRTFVRDKSFLARRHAHLLISEPLVDEPALRDFQIRYRAESSVLERRQFALWFEKAVRGVLETTVRRTLVAVDSEAKEPTPEELTAELNAITSGPPEAWHPGR
jgi:hypothetical protein